MVTAEDNLWKHYFNNLTTSLLNFRARPHAQRHRLVGHLSVAVNAEVIAFAPVDSTLNR